MTRVVIVGAGKGGRALLEMFAGDPTVSILGVTDINPWAPGIEFARRLNVAVATQLRDLVGDPRADLIIDVTGSADVHPTESHHVMARVSHFQDLEKAFIPGTQDRINASAGFDDRRMH